MLEYVRDRVACIAVLQLRCGRASSRRQGDRDKPIHLEADRVTVDDAKQIATFTGNVVLTQGTMILRGDRMEVRQDKAGFTRDDVGQSRLFSPEAGRIRRIIEGWAERIEYDSRADKVQMFNRAMLKRGQDEVRGNYISYDRQRSFFRSREAAPSRRPQTRRRPRARNHAA